MRPLLHRSRLLLSCVLLVFGSAGFAAEQQADGRAPLVVSSLKGDVHATSSNHEVALKVGSSIELPVSLRIGSDGALELHQGLTVISATANSRIDIPKSAESSETLERVLQTRGNVYYSVAKRTAHKLDIETPFLVAVIKGTRFNVSATDTTATVSLLEGSIEIQGGTGDKVDLKAGQMASGSRGTAVRVMQMTTGDIIRRPTSNGKQSVAVRSNPWDQHTTVASTSSALPASDPAVGVATAIAIADVHSPNLGSSGSGNATVRGDDHGASSTLALNQLISQTSANSSAGASGGGSGSSNAGSSGSNASGSTSGGNGNGSSSQSSGNSGKGNSGNGDGNNAGGNGNGNNAGNGNGGKGNSGSSSNASGSNSGSGNSNGNSGNGSSGNSGSSSGGSNSSGQGNSNSNSNGNSGNGSNGGGTKSPGNSGNTVTPGSGTATTGASGKSGSDDSLVSDLESLLSSKTSPLTKKK